MDRIEAQHRSDYLPALDGLRALAVAAVVAYHLGLRDVPGGFLGVDLFFVLSGFLITGILQREWHRAGRVDLRRFYVRRARRLLPALFVVLAALAAWVVADGDGVDLVALRGDVLATIGYVANWRFVAVGESYFDQFSAPTPLRHVWSLAIEEQYYVLWPLLLVGVLRLVRGSRRGAIAVTLALAAASAIAMAVLHDPGGDPSRVYYGTDTRAFELLAGSALGLLAVSRRPTRTRVLGAGAAVALAVLVAMWLTVGDRDTWMYPGGFLLATAAAAVVVAGVARPDPGPLGRALSIAPLRGLGRISYGVYLWHWPVIVLLDADTAGLGGNHLRVLQVAVTLAGSIASYHLVEMPIRSGARLHGWPARLAAPTAAAAVVVALLAVGTPETGVEDVTAAAATSRIAVPAVAATPPLHRLRTPTPDDPLRVMVVGDSVMYDAVPGIEAALEATGVVEVRAFAALGFGLDLVERYDWRVRWPALVEEHRPDVVVSMFGGWDAGSVMKRGEVWYLDLVEEAIDVLRADGAAIVLLENPRTRAPAIPGRPAPDQDRLDAEREAVNRVFRAAAARRPGAVTYQTVDHALSIGGRFTEFLPEGVRIRKRDGTHFCPDGAARMGTVVLAALASAADLPRPDGAWPAERWRSDERYDDPRGTCSD